MGTTTPNIGLYIPADGETNYGTAFANGMLNLDDHDHSGPPNKGVPLSSAGLAAGSVTRDKLNANVLTPSGGLSFDVNNAIQTDGLLNAIYGLASNGFVARLSGSAAASRTLTGTADQIDIANGNGVAGNPTFSFPSTFFSEGTAVAVATSSAGAINGYTPGAFNTMRYQRIGKWILIDYELAFTGTGGPVGDLQLNAPFATVGPSYWLSGYFSDGVTQEAVSYAVNASLITAFRLGTSPGTWGAAPGTLIQIPAGAFGFNVQFTGVYKIA